MSRHAHAQASFASSLRHAGGLCRCRHEAAHSEQATRAESAGMAPAKPFALPGTSRKYERDVPFRIEKIALDLTLDIPKRSVSGVATIDLRRVDREATLLKLDAVSFTIASVTITDHGAHHAGDAHAKGHAKKASARFVYDDATITITVPRGFDRFSVAIEYEATPKRGLYFLAPDAHVQDRPLQVWSQCQDEDARLWFPCHDKPHVKQATEMRVRVPKGWFALSNGTLVERRDDKESSFFHWKQDLPHASYLVTLAAGELAEIRDRDAGVPVTYYVPKGQEADGVRAFGRTPAMIELFEKRTGVKYPWVKYAQVVVHDFTFGGMENTSATTMFEHILLDERAAIDVDMDGLVAHELAHQWFGDLVTCRDWSEAWLNEGWATYMELVWKDEGRPEPHGAHAYGRDEYDYALKGELDIYLAEDGGRYRRPIVCRDYDAPIDLFDRHLYQKGGLVLHAIRRAIGDGPFWGGVKGYLEKHAYGSVETRDFQRALEETSGRSLDRIFDLYVHGAGHPELEVSIEHEAATGAAPSQIVLGVRQQQKVDELTRLYEGPLTIEIVEGGVVRREIVQLTTARDTLVLPSNERPEMVVVDPDGDLLATIDVKASADFLRAQLQSGSSARVRWLAAIALGKKDDPRSVKALVDALGKADEFYGVRAEAAIALGEVRGEGALSALVAATQIDHPKVRRAVAQALGKFKDGAATEALKPLALSDRSYLVQAEAARALGGTRQPGAYDTLVETLDRKGWADCVRAGSADGLAALRDERAVPHLTSRTTYGHPSAGRRACMVALAKLDTSRKTRELLEERLDDVDVFVRTTAVRALELMGDNKARPALSARMEREASPSVRRRLREALRDLTSNQPGELKRLKEELEKVQGESHELKARLARIEAKLAGGDRAGDKKKSPPKKPAAPAKKTKATRRR